jgi:hypothetical protein
MVRASSLWVMEYVQGALVHHRRKYPRIYAAPPQPNIKIL